MTSRWTDYDLSKAWEDGWRTCLQDKESAIRADERAKCRAELREKVDELIDTVPDWQFADRIFRWANGTEAFGGE